MSATKEQAEKLVENPEKTRKFTKNFEEKLKNNNFFLERFII